MHDDVPPKQTALVVVDMQNYFMAPGQQVEIPEAREIVPNVNRLAEALRRAGGLVVWIRTISNEDSFRNWSHFHDVLNTPQRKARRHEAMQDGAFGSLLWPGLDVRKEDLIVCKTRYSAFIQGSSSLEAELRKRGITAVWIGGTSTNTCCESTARDAMLLDFRTTMVSDANADHSDAEHNATLINFAINFGDVASTDDLVKRLQVAAG
ncbi:MAG TPA: isochorismatase family cysteine hydrolase [Burkholderiales bacterium]|nr:isochorismatase family cysteine hydrolase [Burkholderiales bacterium]